MSQSSASRFAQAEEEGREKAKASSGKMDASAVSVRRRVQTVDYGSVANGRAPSSNSASSSSQNAPIVQPLNYFAAALASHMRRELTPVGGGLMHLRKKRREFRLRVSTDEFASLQLGDTATLKEFVEPLNDRIYTRVVSRHQFGTSRALDHVLGTSWYTTYDGQLALLAVPPISFSLVQTTIHSRKRQIADDGGVTSYQLERIDTIHELLVRFSQVQAAWYIKTDLQALLSIANGDD